MVLNKRGFTLIELITVVVLLALMAIMIIPPVMDSIDKSKEYSYDEMVDNIESVTKLYISNHRDTISNINVKGSKVKISLQDLVDSGLLKAPIINPKTEDTISLETEVSVCVIDKNKFYISYENITTCTQDSTSPIVSFNINGSTTYANSRNIKVTIKDGNDIDNSSLKYQWTTSTTTPTEASFSDTFVNKGYITSPADVTGIYYLWILAKDTYNNVTISRSEAFYFDNISPTITMDGTTPTTIFQGSIYTDAGATANDNVDGNITSNIQITSDINVNVVGTYTVTYNVSDIAGNVATPVVRTVNVIEMNYIASEGVNKPKLKTGMTAIKWNSGTSTWDTVASPETDTSWYDYTNKEWANAKTSDGSMWVWIPRYVYRISNGWHSYVSGASATIDVQFSMGTDDTRGETVTLDTGTTSNASNNKWTNHPAFTFGSTELTGIWVAKFESSDDGSSNVKIIPNAVSWRSMNLGEIFTKTRSMETSNIYGWGTSGTGIDTHLMKNTEWGAVAYLSRSAYGQGSSKVWVNPSDNHTTGCAGDSVEASYTTGCLRAYNTTNGLKASTTGTIYGVYDMSLGGYKTQSYYTQGEWTAAYVSNGDSSLTTYANSLYTADSKYKNEYSVTSDSGLNNYNNSINYKGDAVYETSNGSDNTYSWDHATSFMPNSYKTFFIRGGYYSTSYDSGIFGFTHNYNYYSGVSGFRPVLLINNYIDDSGSCTPHWTTGGCSSNGQVVIHTDGCGNSHTHTCSCSNVCQSHNDYCTGCLYGSAGTFDVSWAHPNSSCTGTPSTVYSCWDSSHSWSTSYLNCSSVQTLWAWETSCTQPN